MLTTKGNNDKTTSNQPHPLMQQQQKHKYEEVHKLHIERLQQMKDETIYKDLIWSDVVIDCQKLHDHNLSNNNNNNISNNIENKPNDETDLMSPIPTTNIEIEMDVEANAMLLVKAIQTKQDEEKKEMDERLEKYNKYKKGQELTDNIKDTMHKTAVFSQSAWKKSVAFTTNATAAFWSATNNVFGRNFKHEKEAKKELEIEEEKENNNDSKKDDGIEHERFDQNDEGQYNDEGQTENNNTTLVINNVYVELLSDSDNDDTKEIEPNHDSFYNDNDSRPWMVKYIDDWTCQELQDWIKSLKINKMDEIKILRAIKEMEIKGIDINCCKNGLDIAVSFEKYGINQQIGNNIYLKLQNCIIIWKQENIIDFKINNTSNNDKEEVLSDSDNDDLMDDSDDDDDDTKEIEPDDDSFSNAAPPWIVKYVDEWTCKELQDWIKSLKMNKMEETKIINAIKEMEIKGIDINCCENGSDIAASFEKYGITQQIGHNIYLKLQNCARIWKEENIMDLKINNPQNNERINCQHIDIDTVKSKNVNEWSCVELQIWLQSLDIISLQRKNIIIAQIATMEINGIDFNACDNGTDIANSFNRIDETDGNLLFDALQSIKKENAYKFKHIDEWSCDELQVWILSIGLDGINQQKMINAIREMEICGLDLNSCKSVDDIAQSFDTISTNTAALIYSHLDILRQ